MSFFSPPNVEELAAQNKVGELAKALEYKDSFFVRNVRRILRRLNGCARSISFFKSLLCELTLGLLLGGRKYSQSRFSHSEGRIHMDAVSALAELGTPAAKEALVALMDSSDSQLRLHVIRCWGRVRDKKALPSIIAVLETAEPEVRTAAVSALGQIGGPQTIGPLIAALIEHEAPSSSAVRSYGVLFESRDAPKAAQEALLAIGRPAVSSLIDGLKEESEPLRWKVAETLAKIGDVRAVEPLATMIYGIENRPPWDDHGWQEIVFFLAKSGDKGVVPYLSEILENTQDLELSEQTIQYLEELEDAEAVPALVDTLRSSAPALRQSALRALKSLGWRPRSEMERALELVADPDSLSAQEEQELVDMGYDAIDTAVSLLPPDRQIPLLAEFDCERSFKALTGWFYGPDLDAASIAAFHLGRMGTDEAVSILVQQLKRPASSLHKSNKDRWLQAVVYGLKQVRNRGWRPLETVLDYLADKDASQYGTRYVLEALSGAGWQPRTKRHRAAIARVKIAAEHARRDSIAFHGGIWQPPQEYYKWQEEACLE
ncbi:MAG: HEAT repeat domain-containing protein [Anaerolineae bacterium]